MTHDPTAQQDPLRPMRRRALVPRMRPVWGTVLRGVRLRPYLRPTGGHRAALILSLFLLFDASPSPDVASYGCRAWFRTMVTSPWRLGCLTNPCREMSAPLELPCEVVPSVLPEATFAAVIPETAGGVVWGCAFARDGAGNESECIGSSDTP